MDKTLRKTRNAAIRAAKELNYPSSVVTALRSVTSETEITRIMATARSKSMTKDEKATRSRIVRSFTPHSRGVVIFASVMAI